MKSQEPAFELPAGVEVENLSVQRLNETTLRPTTPVVCINRGRKPLNDMFDGVAVTIPPGVFVTEYGAAKHFQDRLIVPGTRNLDLGGFVSWIGIIGTEDRRQRVDPPEVCEPFTDEELQTFGEKVEGLDRGALANPADRDVKVMKTSFASSMSRAHGLRPNVAADAQASEEAAERAAHVFDAPDESATRQAEAEAASAGVEPVSSRRRGK